MGTRLRSATAVGSNAVHCPTGFDFSHRLNHFQTITFEVDINQGSRNTHVLKDRSREGFEPANIKDTSAAREPVSAYTFAKPVFCTRNTAAIHVKPT